MKDVIVIPLRHHALFSYLQSRLIDADISRMYCKEVHYELRGRHYFALAFGNISGGYEVRNAYYKGCLNNKDISLIRHLTEETQETVCVFEGFMDFLSYMTLKLAGDRTVCLAIPCDYLVMNSVNNLKKTLARLQEYSDIHCYLDNDLAGQRTTETIAGMYGGRVSDESCHYAEYKDLNDYLRGKKRLIFNVLFCHLKLSTTRAFFYAPIFSISHHRDCNIVRFNSSIFETYTNLINETDV